MLSLSLFSLCLEFIASNINDVESLIDFPYVVGIQLFERCFENGLLLNGKKNTKAQNALKIFFDAFGGTRILDALDLKSCHLFVNDILSDCPWLVSHLVHLNLSSCKLGDDHDILPIVFNLDRLETLNLHDNCLSDKGIRNGTLRLRYHSKINNSLKTINLSSNDVTSGCLVYLKAYKNINVLRVSSDFSEYNSPGSCRRFTLHRACPCMNSIINVENSGWAYKVIDNWKREYEMRGKSQKSTATSLPESHTSSLITSHKVQSFYSRGIRGLQIETVKKSAPSFSLSDTVLVTNLFYCEHVPRQNSCMDHEDVFSQQGTNCQPNHFHKLDASGSFKVRSEFRKRSCTEWENDVGANEGNAKKLLKVTGTKETYTERISDAPVASDLLDLYSEDKSQKPKSKSMKVKGPLLNKLNDWN